MDRLRATPLVPANGRSKAIPAHFVVLVRVADVNENQHTRGTYLEGMFFKSLTFVVFNSSNLVYAT